MRNFEKKDIFKTLEKNGIKRKRDFLTFSEKDQYILSFGESDVGIILKYGSAYLVSDKAFKNLNNKKRVEKSIEKLLSKPINQEISLNYNSIFDLNCAASSISIKKYIENNISKLDDETIKSLFFIEDNFGIESIKNIDKETIKKEIISYFNLDNIYIDKILDKIKKIKISYMDHLDPKYSYQIINDIYENRYPIDHDLLSSLFDKKGYQNVKIYYNKKFKVNPSGTEINITRVIEEQEKDLFIVYL